MEKKLVIFFCIFLTLNSCKKEDDIDISNNTGTSVVEDLWGVEISDLPEYYFTSDVPSNQVDMIREAYEISSAAWGNYGPLEYWIIGNDVTLADSLDLVYCDTRLEKDPSLGNNDYQACLNRGYNFVDYVNDGGAGLNLRRNEENDYSVFIITHGSKNPPPTHTDYFVVAMHEYFHVYQQAHVFSKNEQVRSSMFPVNPWFVEGGATYMAELLYSQQTNVSSNYLEEVMQWKMQNVNSFLALGIRIEDIQFSDGFPNTQYAYELGAWFTAFLIHHAGLETYLVNFHNDLNDLGFEQSFVVNFGESSQQFLDDFHSFLSLPISEQIQILP
tara:strand:+ start:134 stop:1120 length:987 start_codon:yes stop_codon:yes gene_type:complete